MNTGNQQCVRSTGLSVKQQNGAVVCRRCRTYDLLIFLCEPRSIGVSIEMLGASPNRNIELNQDIHNVH